MDRLREALLDVRKPTVASELGIGDVGDDPCDENGRQDSTLLAESTDRDRSFPDRAGAAHGARRC